MARRLGRVLGVSACGRRCCSHRDMSGLGLLVPRRPASLHPALRLYVAADTRHGGIGASPAYQAWPTPRARAAGVARYLVTCGLHRRGSCCFCEVPGVALLAMPSLGQACEGPPGGCRAHELSAQSRGCLAASTPAGRSEGRSENRECHRLEHDRACSLAVACLPCLRRGGGLGPS